MEVKTNVEAETEFFFIPDRTYEPKKEWEALKQLLGHLIEIAEGTGRAPGGSQRQGRDFKKKFEPRYFLTKLPRGRKKEKAADSREAAKKGDRSRILG